MTRTSNRWLAASWLTVFSTTAALTSAGTKQTGISRCSHSSQCEYRTEYASPFHLEESPSHGNRSFDRPDQPDHP
ncbi:MAG: hypothetical protein DWI00_02150 [Planctomycetota bacterium]|nr:MAG: hypothetical protein DWI00_02150 [Planctomycetota bacterium]